MSLSKSFRFTEILVRNISEISHIQGECGAKNFSPDDRLLFVQQSLAESSHYSTKIEGNTLSLKQVTAALDQKALRQKTRDLKEVINYSKARRFLFEANVFLDEKNLLKSHDLLLAGILTKSMRGRYRTIQNAIKDAQSNEIVYLPPEWRDVPKLIKEMIMICEAPRLSLFEAIVNSGIFHFHFESIHPFLDGNGRLGRLWSSNLLKNHGLDFVEFTAIEKYHENHRNQYYEQLHFLQENIFYNISSHIDLTPWLEYWTSGLLSSAREALDRIQGMSSVTKDLIFENRLSNGIKLFKNHIKLTALQYQQLTGLGRTQAVDDLNKLFKLKVIKRVGGGRSTAYILSENKRKISRSI